MKQQIILRDMLIHRGGNHIYQNIWLPIIHQIKKQAGDSTAYNWPLKHPIDFMMGWKNIKRISFYEILDGEDK